MTETQKRIQAYKDALPGVKERVFGVAILLLMSVVMITSATFAWLTISRAPEVTGVSTTVAANGNLEIALAGGNGRIEPGESQVGDSFAAEGKSVVDANLTWGNLVNLSDPSYGLENLILRPAQLNTAELLTSPLYGADYDGDGRISQLSSDFGYATWNVPTGDKPGHFAASEMFGVRAISSMKIEAVGAEATYIKMVNDARDKNAIAASTYSALSNKTQYMQSLATMMGLYMTARMNPSNATLSNPDCDIADLQNLRDMYAAFLECYDLEAEAIAAQINLIQFLCWGQDGYDSFTKEDIYKSTAASLAEIDPANTVKISDFDQFIKDHNTIASDYAKLVTICSSGTTLKWKDSGLNDIVNNLVDVGKCTIGANNTPISSIGASNASSYLKGTQEARITNGVLYRFEERTGGYIEVKNLGISATVERYGFTVPATVKANIQTTAPRDYNLFTNDQNYAKSLNDGNYKGGTSVAEDTYGLAVDLWVRTNAQASYLTLEGNVLYEVEKNVPVTTKNADGESVQVYTLTRSVESEGTDENGNPTTETFSATYELYNEKEDASGTWYMAVTHSVFQLDEGETPVAKVEDVYTVSGYEGVNRVWDESKGLSADATTQGSGSCYVYYADTPEDQARSLQLLKSLKVAFIDANGKLLAGAVMDTENFYADNGRVIVPLVLDTSSSINLGEDVEGNTTYAITTLEKNKATRITAIVYLDGSSLTNDEVLAAADIQGQLNIQFGSSQMLEAIPNEKLEQSELRVSAAVSETEFNYDEDTDLTTTVTVMVEGDQPNSVEAFFLRSINANQGAREERMRFTPQGDGTWVANYTFTAPGNYVLRTVELDGQEYALKQDTLPSVTVKGFTVRSLSCSEATNNHIRIMTADSSSTVNMELKFATDDPTKMPSVVQGRFLNDTTGAAVNINFTYNPTDQIWRGSAVFLSSGDYTMEYVVLDGEYFALEDSNIRPLTASVILGMKVAVYTTSPHKFKYVPSEMTDNQKLLNMQVMVMDNTGAEMPGLSGVKLTYTMKGSGAKRMDTDLTWNGTYYVGELTTTGPGIWQFAYVEVDGDVISSATTCPTFTIQSPEPPEYYGHDTAAYQYAPNRDAVMNVQITNSGAASVQAYIVKDGASEGVWVDGALGGEFTTSEGKTTNNWNFTVPIDANGYQDSNWQLTHIRLWDVFAADGTAYTEEAPLVFDVANNKTKVVNRIYVNFGAEDQSKNFSGSFMQTHSVAGLNVTIKDFEGPVAGIDNVKIAYKYAGGSEEKGGYSGGNVPASGVTVFTVDLAQSSTDGTVFTQSEAENVQFAGTYNPTLSFTMSGTTNTITTSSAGVNVTGTAPAVTVSSVVPTVKITSAMYASKTGGNSEYTDTSTTVYYKESTETACGITYYNYTPAKVVLTLDGYGNATGAKLEFTTSRTDGNVHLYEESQKDDGTATNAYSWSADGACTRYMGYWESKTGSDGKAAAETLKSTTLILAHGGADYSVPVAITINNPS